VSVSVRKLAVALLLPLFGCGSPYDESAVAYVPPTVDSPRSCVRDNGAWCITTPQAAVAQEREGSVYWTLRDAGDNTGLIVAPKSCRGGSADGVYRRTKGTVLREGETWRIARIGFREDRTCEVLFMAPDRASASLRNLFLTRVNVCMAGTDCASLDNVLVNRIGPDDLF
jgi:hypothetical protein